MPGLNLGDEFPNAQVETTKGNFKLHDYMEDKWLVFCSHPADYTPVCTTELGALIALIPEFEKRNVKIIALSCDGVDSHHGWIKDLNAQAGCPSNELLYPIIADKDRELAVKLGMIDPLEKDAQGLPLTARAVFIVAPDKKLKLSILYPATTGRNFNEVLRVIDSLQLTLHKKVATPVNWQNGGECMVLPTVSAQEASSLFPQHRVAEVPSGKGYLRFTPQP
ncbi:peroxiredoxin-6-like [Watersipora subatra]|uniref:peroxiredoxin-6-like n=1 Tax=Watersipora subatra TaxID=2589382 RepID=UPI00355BB615